MPDLKTLASEVACGRVLSRKETLELWEAPLDDLCAAAGRLARMVSGDRLDVCAIVNARSLPCPQDCAFCAQSARHGFRGGHEWLPRGELARSAAAAYAAGARWFSLVATGRRLSHDEVAEACNAVRAIRNMASIRVCASLGLLEKDDYARLRDSGLNRVHLNLETSQSFFPKICSTHTWDDKVRAIRAAKAAGLDVCSGGILGMGESPEDRIDLALSLRELGVSSVPLNILDPIPGTPLGERPSLEPLEAARTVAVFRFLLPRARIRLAGGRRLLPDRGRLCLVAGADALMTGHLLTTQGLDPSSDRMLAEELGWRWPEGG